MLSVTFGFQILVIQPANRRISGAPTLNWTMPQPVGDVRIAGTRGSEDLKESCELTVFGTGYSSEEDARFSGIQMSSWLRVTSALSVLGFDLGDQRQLSWLAQEVVERFEADPGNAGCFLTLDVHGLITFEERGRPLRPAVRISQAASSIMVVQSSDQVFADLTFVASAVTSVSDSVSMACDLISTAEHLASDDARFLTHFYAMECLAEPPERIDEGREWVEQALLDLRNERGWLDPADRESLMGAVSRLKRRSTKWALIDLARQTRPNDPNIDQVVTRAYGRRNERVHPGTAKQPLGDLVAIVLPLLQDELRYILQLGPPSETETIGPT
jgi:hypothetical protein